MNENKFRDLQFTISKAFSMVSATDEYKSWSDEFARQEISETLTKLRGRILKDYNLTECTDEQLAILGFSTWEVGSSVRLIPLHLFRCIPDGTKVNCIDGEEFTVGKDDLDNDIRFGCVAYGITASDKQQG